MALLVSFLIAFFSIPLQAQTAVPQLQGHVTDSVGFLSESERSAMNERLVQFEKKTGSQIFVLVIDSLGDEPIEDFSQRVFEAWKPGRKGIDNGVLFVVAAQDHKMRIHTGYGVEGVLPDALAKRILSNIVAPAFRENERARGMNEALDAIMAAIEKEPLPAAVEEEQEDFFSNNLGWFIGGFASLLAAVILPFRRRFWGILALILNGVIWIPILILLPYITQASDLVQGIAIVLGSFAGFVSIGHLIMSLGSGSSRSSSYSSSDSSSYSSSDSWSASDSSSDDSWSSSDSSSDSWSPSDSSSSDSSSGGGGDSGGGGASSDW